MIADAMVKNGEVPKYEKVAARYQSRKAAWIRRNTPESPVELSNMVVARLYELIERSWREGGRGPFWGEVRDEMGWDQSQTRDALHRLRESGGIHFTNDAGSLTAGDNRSLKASADVAMAKSIRKHSGSEHRLVAS
ncbi:hypothetical protein [Arthrobacter sp. NyZ413]|uniref:hypothetical protein n=1 Tax=Arthrobacter sp. NyZ413 TaxID=3144669 RepID=UPI003BF8E22F